MAAIRKRTSKIIELRRKLRTATSYFINEKLPGTTIEDYDAQFLSCFEPLSGWRKHLYRMSERYAIKYCLDKLSNADVTCTVQLASRGILRPKRYKEHGCYKIDICYTVYFEDGTSRPWHYYVYETELSRYGQEDLQYAMQNKAGLGIPFKVHQLVLPNTGYYLHIVNKWIRLPDNVMLNFS